MSSTVQWFWTVSYTRDTCCLDSMKGSFGESSWMYCTLCSGLVLIGMGQRPIIVFWLWFRWILSGTFPLKGISAVIKLAPPNYSFLVPPIILLCPALIVLLDMIPMDPLFMANSLFRRRRFEECVKVCTSILQSNPYDQVSIKVGHYDWACNLDNICKPHLFLKKAAWFLKIRAITEQTYVDEIDMDEEGIAELFMDDSVLADVASK